MKNAALGAVDAILGGLEKFLGFIPSIGDKIHSARESIANMIDSEKVKRDAKDVERTIAGMTDAIKSELEQQKSDALSALADKKKIAQEGYDDAITKIKEEYGEYKSATKNKMDLARDASEASQRALEDELKSAKRIHDEKISLLEKEYNQKIRTLNAEADYQITAIQQQIDAIDAQTREEDLILTRANEARRLDELKAAVDSATTAEDIAEAQAKYEEYHTGVTRNELLRRRDEEKNALRDEIADIRSRTETQIDNLNKELEAHKATLLAEYASFEENQNKIIASLDIALELELARLDTERAQKEADKLKEYNDTVKLLSDEETAITASFDARLTEAAIYQAALEATLKDIEQTVTTTYVEEHIGGGGTSPDIATQSHAIHGYATGGIVPGPIGAPILATVHGGETIIPANESMGGVTVNISGPLFMEREDQMNQLVDKISKGIDRKQRLRFGGAYNG